jgi:diacylglycerol kinase (ATP)
VFSVSSVVNFKKATLLYNPRSGNGHHKRLEQVEAAVRVLHEAHVEVDCVPTEAAGSGGGQAREAIARGSDTIFACGGDGTLHDVLQGMVGTEAALGVIPLGTANALAYDLQIPFDPVKAARKQLAYMPRLISAGTIEYERRSGGREQRYFTVMCGAGPDAAMVYELSAGWKSELGLFGYLAKSAEMFLTHHFAAFEGEFVDARTGELRTVETVSLMAVRISDFGNVLRKLAPGAALEKDLLRIVILKKNARVSFVLHLVSTLFGYRGKVPGVEYAWASEVCCRQLPEHPEGKTVHAEADGEHLGCVPVRIGIEKDAFKLLMPPERAQTN